MFKEQQYADEFREGKLFANPLSYFQKIEAQEGQFDADEGSTWTGEDDILTLSSKSMGSIDITNDDLAEPMRIQQINHVNVICFHEWKLPITKINELPADLGEQTVNIQIPKRLKNEFGDSAVIVANRNKFYNRLGQELARQRIKGNITAHRKGWVQYADHKPLFWDIQNSLDAAFYKNTRYSYQREYRVAFERRFIIRGGTPYTLNIGDIKDITIAISTSDVLNLRISTKSQ